MMGLSSLSPESPYYLGLVGMPGTTAANRAVLDCDLLIAVGARFSDRVTGNREKFAENAKIIHIDIDQSEISKNVRADYSLIGDSGDCLEMLLCNLPEQKRPDWMHAVLKNKALNTLPDIKTDDNEISAKEVITTLNKIAGPDTIIAPAVGPVSYTPPPPPTILPV